MHISQWPKSDNRWFLGVLCQNCHSPILFGLDRSDGESTYTPPAKLLLTCSQAECRHQADYSGAKISRFQKASATR